MNKKGFTLIELISVIALIAIVSTLVFKVVTDKIQNSKKALYENLISDLEKAGEKYMLEHNDVDKYHLNTLCIDIPTLQENNYIEKGKIKDPRTKEELSGYVKVTYDNSKNQYEFKYTETCTQNLVTPLVETILNNEDIKVTGNTDGLYETTDSYVYRGTNPNNYLSLNGNTADWRIVSIDKSTNMIKAVTLKDQIQPVTPEGLFTYVNRFYDSGTTYESFKDLIKTNSKWNTGKIDKLDSTETIKSVEKQSSEFHTIGLLTMGDYLDASLDKNCYSSNDCTSYLTTSKNFWLINTTSDNKQWYVENNTIKNTDEPNSKLFHVYPVLYLTVNTSLTGDGTPTNPYK